MWDSPSFWIWVIIVVVSFLARKKKEKQPTSPSEPYETSNETKPVSFEDLLREIQASKAPAPPPSLPKKQPQPVSTFEETDYDEVIEDENQDLERVDYKKRDQDETFEAYEKAKLAAFNRPSLEETMNVEDTQVRFSQFKGYQQDTPVNVANAYVQDLSDPDGFKRAFILSEILNRRF